MKEKRSSVMPARIFLLFLVIFAVPILARLIESIPISVTELAKYVLNPAILAGFLAWLIPKIRLSRWSLTLLVWLELLVVEFLNNYVEALFFTNVSDNAAVLVQSVTSALIASATSAIASALLLGHGTTSITASLKDHLATRGRNSWILRIAVGSAAYFPVYFFGALIAPFILPYYNSPSFGLRIPPFAVMVPVELFRGFVYTLVLLPLLATIAASRTTKFIALAVHSWRTHRTTRKPTNARPNHPIPRLGDTS